MGFFGCNLDNVCAEQEEEDVKKIDVNFNITAEGIDIALFIVEMLMLLVAFLSAIYAYKAYRHQKDRSKKNAACELAKYYADDILENGTTVINILTISGYEEFITGILSHDKMCDFTNKELETILKDSPISYTECIEKIQNIEPEIIIRCRMARTYSLKERTETLQSIAKINEESGKIEFPTKAHIRIDFMQDLTKLMNHLEWFSMNCRYGIADEELIYQSLHQTFLSMVLLMYPLICNANKDNADKHYTNIIWLFNRWSCRRNDIKKCAESKRQKYLKKANAVEQEVFSGKSVK